MSYYDRLNEEINTLLDELAERGETWNANWIAHAICGAHEPGLNLDSDHSDFWRHTGYSDTRREVRQCINRRAGEKPGPTPEQLRFPGWQHLQAYYVVRRGDEDVGVPVTQLTTDEIRSKAALYRSMGEACFAHARELDRFINEHYAETGD